MIKSYSVVFTNRAQADLYELRLWWRDNRPKAPGAVREELGRAVEVLEAQPNIGTIARNVALQGVRRIHLSRLRQHIYYRVDEKARVVEVLAVWHSNKGTPPPV